MHHNKFWIGAISFVATLIMFSSSASAQIVFDFANDSEFDGGQGIGTTMTRTAADGSSATASIVDLFTPAFVDDAPTETILRASQGDEVTTEINSNTLGVDNSTVVNSAFFGGAGQESRDFNDREGLVIEFDVPVVFTAIDFSSLDDGTATITIEGVGSFDFVEDAVGNPSDIFLVPFGSDFIPAGADITITFSSPDATDANVRISEFAVATSAEFLTQPRFDFNNDTEFADNQGIGATMTATALDGNSTATMSIVDLFAPEFVNNAPTETILRASLGDLVTTEIGNSNSVGVDNPSVSDDDFFEGAGVEERDINDGEGLVFEFDVPVVITNLEFASLDDGTVTVDIAGVGSFLINNDDENPNDAFSLPFGTNFIPAGADITVSLSSPDDASANVRIQEITVSTVAVAGPCLLGDVDMSGAVDFLDIVPFIGVLSSDGFQCEADVDENGSVNFLDIVPFIAILSGP